MTPASDWDMPSPCQRARPTVHYAEHTYSSRMHTPVQNCTNSTLSIQPTVSGAPSFHYSQLAGMISRPSPLTNFTHTLVHLPCPESLAHVDPQPSLVTRRHSRTVAHAATQRLLTSPLLQGWSIPAGTRDDVCLASISTKKFRSQDRSLAVGLSNTRPVLISLK